jgi:hypothetical protein
MIWVVVIFNLLVVVIIWAIIKIFFNNGSTHRFSIIQYH